MPRQRSAAISLLALFCSVASLPAEAQVPDAPETDEADNGLAHDIGWQDHYRPIHWSEPVIGALFLGGFILVDVFLEGSEEPSWEGGILFDQAVRDGIVGGNQGIRHRADVLSDVFWYTGSAYPLIDAIIVVGLVRERWDVSWQLGVMWFETTSFAGFTSRLTQRTTLRERPLRTECADNPDYSPLCFTQSANSSFISGHTAGAMAGAGQTCAVHQHLDLYGSELAGTLTCVGNISLGLLAGIFRMVSDRHWATDVIAGGLIGFGAGYLVPWLHFNLGEPDEGQPSDGRHDEPGDAASLPSVVLTPWSGDGGWGFELSGTF